MGVLLLSAFGVSAQCLVGGTDFNPPTSLCNPTLTQAQWLTPINTSNKDALFTSTCGSTKYVEDVYNAQHLYDITGTACMASVKEGGEMILERTWVAHTLSSNGIQTGGAFAGGGAAVGVGGVVANPRALSHFFMDMPGKNIFVHLRSNINNPFFIYSVGGLEPGTDVFFTAKAYNLIDLSVWEYYRANGFPTNSSNVYGYDVQNSGSNEYRYDFGTGALMASGREVEMKLAVGTCTVPVCGTTGISINLVRPTIIGLIAGSEVSIPQSNTTGVDISATGKADANGNVVFYLARTSDCWRLPVGIDDIRIKGTVKPRIIYTMDPCKLDPITFSLAREYPAGTTYSWEVESVPGATGSAKNFVFQPLALGASYKIKVTVTTPECDQPISSETTITLRPKTVMNKPADQVLCNGTSTNAVTFSSSMSSAVTYSWTNNTPSIGLPASGNGNIGAFTSINTGTSTVTATITVTPTSNGCVGDLETFTIAVKPTPTVTKPADLTECHGRNTAAVNITGNMSSAATYNWTNSEPSIGLSSSGSGNIASFLASNTGETAINATITITPVADGCTGNAVSFTITVNPPFTKPNVKDHISCPAPTSTIVAWSSLIDGPISSPKWYSAATGGSPIADPGNFDASVPQTKSYWISETIDGCESQRAEIKVDISAEPSAPSVSNYDECALDPGASKTWTSLVTTSGNFTWYSANNDASELSAEPAPFNTGTAMASTTYYVIVTDAMGCKSTRAAVTARVKARPTAVLSGDPTICKGQNASLTVNFTGSAPFQFTYSDGSTISSQITATTNPYTITSLSPASTRSYNLVSLSDAQCVAVAADLSGTSLITVNDRPVTGAITLVPAICSGNSFSASNPSIDTNGATINLERWEIGTSGGTFAVISAFPYTVSDSDNGKTLRFIAGNVCGTDTSETLITVDPLPIAVISSIGGSICPDGTFDISGSVTNGTLSWSTDGGGTISDPTAENTTYHAVASDAGKTITFTLTATSNNVCAPETATATKNNLIVVPFPIEPTVNGDVIYYSIDIPFKNILLHKPNAVTPSAGNTLYWWHPETLQWTTTPPTPPTPAAGDYTNKLYTYDVKQKMNSAPYCESPVTSVDVWIYMTPAPKVKDASYCEGETPLPLDAPFIVKDPTGYTESDFEFRWYASNNLSDNSYTTVNPTPLDNTGLPLTPGEKTYWVSQFNNVTLTESNRVSLKVTVYAKPVLSITNPKSACVPDAVNITLNSGANSVWQITNNTYVPSLGESAKYYDDAAGSIPLPNAAAITAAGKRNYYIQAAFTMPPATMAGAPYCYSDIKPVEVDIHDLKTLNITGETITCPNTSVTLTANLTGDNLGAITYSWARTNQQTSSTQTIGSTQAVSSGNLSGVAFDKYTFKVTATDGVCTKESGIHTVTIGDAPIIGTMTVSEPGSTNPSKTFLNNNPKEFYTCGGNIDIVTAFTNTDSDSFVWYIGSTKVGDGKDLTITNMQNPERNRTYRLEYINECPASVTITVHSVPLSVTNDLQAEDMGLCEGDEFKAALNITCSENPVTSIKWFKDGNPLSAFDDKQIYAIASAKPSDSGVYSYTVTNRGCVVSDDIADGTPLNVSPMVRPVLLPIRAVCEGDVVTIGYEQVTPAQSILTWRDPEGTIQGSNVGLTVDVKPPFRWGSGHRSTYTYTIDGRYDYCSMTFEVQVYVDEPLKGDIMADSPICEGESAVINASSYDAQIYVWTSAAFEGEKQGARITESPEKTSTYNLQIFRGECKAKDAVTIIVNTNPRIVLIDSLGVRTREIIYDPDYGTLPFMFKVDNGPEDGNSVKSGLLFAYHTYYIEDVVGCKAQWSEPLDPPPLFPPIFFSPDGDGINDTWEVPNIREVYPEAVITIYDRFGKQLATYKGEDAGWDGTYRGAAMPSTDYWYVIVVDEIKMQYTGHFTLLRQ